MSGSYNKRCHIIYNIIDAKFPAIKFQLESNHDNNLTEILFEYLPGNISVITILPDSTIQEIERNIKVKLTDETDGHCIVCFETEIKRVACPRCGNYFCGECYINIFRHNNGLIKCPHCRFTDGKIQHPNMIETLVDDIRSKLTHCSSTY